VYCPKCKTEYVQGILVCVDCGIALIPELAAEPSHPLDAAEYEEVLTDLNASDVALIKSLLNSESIEHYIEGEFSPYGIHRLMVLKEQAVEAQEILKDLALEHVTVNKPKDWHED
jgi:hypothetical protein